VEFNHSSQHLAHEDGCSTANRMSADGVSLSSLLDRHLQWQLVGVQ